MKFLVISTLILFSTVACSESWVGILNLLADTKQYEGQNISVLGYLHKGSKNLSLHLTKDYAENHKGPFGIIYVRLEQGLNSEDVDDYCLNKIINLRGVITHEDGFVFLTLSHENYFYSKKDSIKSRCNFTKSKPAQMKLDFYGRVIK
jgi:hypothetical protein